MERLCFNEDGSPQRWDLSGNTGFGSRQGWVQLSSLPESFTFLKMTRSLSPVSYTHLRAHETPEHLVCRLLLEKKKTKTVKINLQTLKEIVKYNYEMSNR
eukprot:TRINITY_DN7048_c0_g1_i1.p1 TRINITY_DN7048_c0_g1~~TRINITY_DN7048_c0_g1_i1.p1  ORF type:complete len:100 (+),score=2.40 TRINITY_DN7048_c0_g1_i1:206-505(+)